jgi:lipase maturation factor 1
MKSDAKVAAPPAKPLVLFDGDCHFCSVWIRRWKQITGERVDYLAFQEAEISRRFPELNRERFATSLHLIEPNGNVYTGAQAVFRAVATNPAEKRLLRWYDDQPLFANASEAIYRFVAGHRTFFSWMTRIGWGEHAERPDHFLVRSVFLRCLGAIYLIAFLSLSVQLSGLIGSSGILPAQQMMESAHAWASQGHDSFDAVRQLPTLCWINASDSFLKFLCAGGAVLAVLLIAGVAPVPTLGFLWLFYLSLSVVGRDFLSFQWDTLLLEAGFMAIFFAPRQLLPGLSRESAPSRTSVWLLRWLLFRLMFQSGVTKLTYGDGAWVDLTALTFHYETQPLPTWIGWHAHHAPVWLHRFSCLGMYAVEIIVPFLFFAPRRLRFAAALATILLELLIALSGNYTFFNLLAMVLCVPLLDDALIRGCCRRLRLMRWANWQPPRFAGGFTWRSPLFALFAMFVLVITTADMLENCRVNWRIPRPVLRLSTAVAPFRTLNSYGLFRVMTRPRYELIIEGSNDAVTWEPYEFKYKPGDLKRRPAFVEPHQPRLDWQMWFEALRPSGAGVSVWFGNFCMRLIKGEPQVVRLLAKNPFPNGPPRHFRVMKYEYHFTTPSERSQTGTWWKRELRGSYIPAMELSPQRVNGQPE